MQNTRIPTDRMSTEQAIAQPACPAEVASETGVAGITGFLQVVDEDPLEHIAVLGYN